MITHVFFDLDGTLADTASDLAAALNQVLSEQGRPSLPLKTIRPSVSLGANAMIKLAFGMTDSDPAFDRLRRRFLNIYETQSHQHTDLFPGTDKMLRNLELMGIKWGVITNKQARFTWPLMEKLGLHQRALCIVSGDTTAYRKPHPQPMLYACSESRCDPNTSLYVGDTKRDVQAGKAAGMMTLTVSYGYTPNGENPDTWQADGYISTPEEIIDWVSQVNRS